MFLLIWPKAHETVQRHEVTINSHLLGRIADGDLELFRFQSGRFERLYATTEEVRPGYGRFVPEWREVCLEVP